MSDRSPKLAKSSNRSGRSRKGLTCANCRDRKTRCDGRQPGCRTCEVYNVDCRYEKVPPLSQILSMAKKLQDAENTVEELRSALRQAQETTSSEASVRRDALSGYLSTSPSVEGAAYAETVSTTLHGTESEGGAEKRLLSDLSLDENGKLCYYGPTSAVHAPPPGQTAEGDDTETHSDEERAVMSGARTILTTNALESRTWEEFALGNAAIQTNIPRHVISRLLQIHWAWIAPTFNWVYRPAFMRDMAVGGPCYSPFLLTVMCAHAARFDQGKTSELLISRARLLLGSEIHRPSSIPTVQALLQLSARDLAYGSISQAWLYSGMAFRMVSDLGLHHSTAKFASLGNLGAEDLEIRRRLFWSCYFWDKAISLYLGRMPVLPELPFERAPVLLDDSAENDIWSPHQPDAVNLSKVSPGEYPPMKSHVVSSFQNSCKLSVILNDIIFHLYSRRPTSNADETLRGIRQQLDDWRDKSPAHLRYDPDNLPSVCPPPHILTQNLFYYATIILLHRPFRSVPAHHAACRKACDNIEKLVLLLEKTFGFTRITYLMAYCIYTAASVLIQDVKKGDIEAHIRMQTFLQALRQGIATCPVVQRSLDIITNGLRSDAASASLTSCDDVATEQNALARDYLPAFPYRDLDMDCGVDLGQSGMDLDGFSLLDCFPEVQYDNLGSGGEWFFPSV